MGARVISTLLVVLLASCYNSFDGDAAAAADDTPAPNMLISELHALLGWQSTEITALMVIEGQVTATDESGNLYRSFIIENDGYAVEVLEGLYDSYLRHPIGTRVTISLSGLAISRSYGVMQVGLKAAAGSDYRLDYITAEPLIDRHLFIGEALTTPVPQRMDIGDLAPEQCGSLITIERLQYHPESGASAPTWGGQHTFEDNRGNSIIVSTSPYANFATVTLPLVAVSITGILQYYNGEYYLKMRDVADCTL